MMTLPEYRIHDPDENGKKYTLYSRIVYTDPKTGKTLTLEPGYKSDGATGAMDIRSNAWWVHDLICDRGTWDDGTKIHNLEASNILRKILWSERRYLRSIFWFASTWLIGGGKARDNGMF